MSVFKEKFEAFLVEFNKGKTMVLSSSENNKVTSRMMSIVCIDGLFFFEYIGDYGFDVFLEQGGAKAKAGKLMLDE